MNEANNNASSSDAPTSPRRTGIDVAIGHMLSNKIEALLWLTRIGTIIFTFLAVVPLFGVRFVSCYERALLCNAATSALRLHLRLPVVTLTREFLSMLLMEDSCHYLLYSLLFIYSGPVIMSLQPIFLFACLYSAIYTATLCQKMGLESFSNSIVQIVQTQQRNVLKFVALSEICLLPLTVFALFSGRGSLITPFAYYRFLTLRYTSRRNPYSRTVFHELRLLLENFASTPGRSAGLRNICYRIISMVSRLAPPLPTATAQ